MSLSNEEFGERYAQVPVPDDLVKALMAAETMWQFDYLDGIIEAPTMTLDGTIIDQPGYNRDLGLFYDPRNVPQMKPIGSTPDDAVAGLAKIHDTLDEFPFSDNVEDGEIEGQSKSVAVSAILTAPVRRVLPICPIFLIDAPTASTGKTLLADVIAAIPTGRGAGATTWSGNSEEQRKVITSILVAGDLVVNFDNVTAPIGGAEICKVTTAQANFKDRLLGSTKMLDLPTNVMWLYTGNNMIVKEDAATRALKCRLDAGLENPEKRVFKRPDLIKYVLEQRGELLHACLTILRAYIVTGKPLVSISGRPFVVSSRFNEWSSLVAGALCWLDQPDPLGSQAAVIADDPVKETHRNIMTAWRDAFGLDAWVTAKQLLADDDSDDLNYQEERAAGKVFAAIQEIEAGGKAPSAIAIKLKTFENKIVDGMKLRKRKADRAKHISAAWMLTEIAQPGRPVTIGEPWE
jgi:putative DNA primase/helicase